MPPRRSHTKSRTGCQRCKSRRIKCDETHPSCNNCINHAIVCDFSLLLEEHRATSQEVQAAPRVTAAHVMTPSSTAASSPAELPTPRYSPSVPDVQQSRALELMDSMPSLIFTGALDDDDGWGEAPGISPWYPITVFCTIGPSGCSDSDTMDPLLLHSTDGMEWYNPGLPSPSPSSLPSPSHNATSASQLSISRPLYPGIATVQQTSLNVLDLSLMHHWSTSTSYTVTSRGDVQQLWRIHIPVMAFQHPFLMHSTLAVSALHLHSKESDPSKNQPLLSAATHHYERAVRSLAASLTNITPDNCQAIFVAAGQVAIFSFVASRISDTSGHKPSQIASWIPLLRGVKSILMRSWDWVITSPLAPIITQHQATGIDALDAETEQAIQSLYRLCTDRTLPDAGELSDPTVSTAYFSAIAELRRAFTEVSSWDSVLGDIFKWHIFVADRFVELLNACRPRALVIFVHYCALFTRFEKSWWARGSFVHELRKCEKHLGEEWRPWITWPRLMILAGNMEGAANMEGAGLPGGRI